MCHKKKASIYIEAFLFKLYLYIVCIPKEKPHINKTIKYSSIGPSAGGGGIAEALLPGEGGVPSARTLDTFIKVIKNANKTVFVIFINLNILKNNSIYY
ncbi:hypothetical protein SD960_14335 [Flavobacterium sp. MMLR14_040]|uniref:hypothetical protein n=1 Tax=Flavobacterium sp. MMLR14_040 TaxID=3093843 RepID=UPI0029902CC8|nr:hypothetical protein [Flavobacterium sp. MMLR14_040]MDW8851280.1 hypothetical protein [Flavobacterium sp. MMLR14_040]